MFDAGHGIVEVEATQFNHLVEIGDGELGIDGTPVIPDAPYEQGEDSLGIAGKEIVEVEDLMIVQRNSHADGTQRRSIALQVLDGVGIGVEHVRTAQHGSARLGNTLYQIVVVGIYTAYKITTRILGQQPHQHRFLTAFQTVA